MEKVLTHALYASVACILFWRDAMYAGMVTGALHGLLTQLRWFRGN